MCHITKDFVCPYGIILLTFTCLGLLEWKWLWVHYHFQIHHTCFECLWIQAEIPIQLTSETDFLIFHLSSTFRLKQCFYMMFFTRTFENWEKSGFHICLFTQNYFHSKFIIVRNLNETYTIVWECSARNIWHWSMLFICWRLFNTTHQFNGRSVDYQMRCFLLLHCMPVFPDTFLTRSSLLPVSPSHFYLIQYNFGVTSDRCLKLNLCTEVQ